MWHLRHGINNPGNSSAKELSTLSYWGLSAAAALSPGIALLRIAYKIKDGKSINDMNSWMGNFIWFFWIIALIDFVLDKIPGISNINHFVEHATVLAVVYVVATSFTHDTGLLSGILAGNGLHVGRQMYRTTDMVGIAPVTGTLEDILSAAVSWFII